ncbi:DUF2169 family type VI secretion system accessory protein [Roseateles chitinivorans]|uniref:DUF2169 family type VI secretion system accessory protein n=1 Tax=Roseateles chitinivorans TaxID=2917965 RepID=UPI003D67F3EE
MIVVNPTAYAAGWSVGHRPDGREVAVVVVKGTFVLSACGERGARLADEQQPLHEADVLGEDPAVDAPLHDHDFALFKPRCDVLLSASAHAPDGRPVTRLDAGFMVGDCRKALSVVGRREWRKGVLGWKSTEPEPFVTQPISYDHAFGGTEIDPSDPTSLSIFRRNPSGTGHGRIAERLAGAALPTTEEIGHPVSNPHGDYAPMAFGPLGRHWLPRCGFAGTYDARWMAEKRPWLPDDFDPRYDQAAPPDQQMPYPVGGETIVLANLASRPRIEARLPRDEVVVRFLRHRAPVLEVPARLDTVFIAPDEDRLCLTWRAACPLDRDPFELREMQIETTLSRTPGLLRARQTGKTHYRHLADLVRARRGGRR